MGVSVPTGLSWAMKELKWLSPTEARDFNFEEVRRLAQKGLKQIGHIAAHMGYNPISFYQMRENNKEFAQQFDSAVAAGQVKAIMRIYDVLWEKLEKDKSIPAARELLVRLDPVEKIVKKEERIILTAVELSPEALEKKRATRKMVVSNLDEEEETKVE